MMKIKNAHLALPRVKGEDGSVAPLLVLFRILEDCYLQPYLPKQLLNRLVSAESNSKRSWC